MEARILLWPKQGLTHSRRISKTVYATSSEIIPKSRNNAWNIHAQRAGLKQLVIKKSGSDREFASQLFIGLMDAIKPELHQHEGERCKSPIII